MNINRKQSKKTFSPYGINDLMLIPYGENVLLFDNAIDINVLRTKKKIFHI